MWICVFLTRLASQRSKDAALISSCSHKGAKKGPRYYCVKVGLFLDQP